MTDTVADFLTRIRNAIRVNHRIVSIPASNLKKAMTQVLYEKGYILKYKFEDDGRKRK
jgi:small subunit ribosomal protein S8